MPQLTSEQISTNKKNYKTQTKQAGSESPIAEEEVDGLLGSLNNLPEKDRTEIERALNNDFGNYNNLNKYYRNCIATKAVRDMEKQFEAKDMNFDNPKFVEYLDKNVMNCALHKGISLLKTTKPYLASMGQNFSRMLLNKTLQLPSKTDEERVISELGEEAGKELLQKNLEKQKIMAKTLFMAQIGKYNLKQKNVEGETDFDGLLSETIVHGGRTNFILPYGAGQNKVMKAIYGAAPEESAGLQSRAAATHYATRQKMNDDGSIKSKSTEESPWSITLHKILPNQHGMNIAVGGIGSVGPDQKTILPNGAAGHMYVRREMGGEHTCGSLLVGFESADSGATSFTGHKHNFRAISAQQSAFLADKGVVGKKTDGRTVDLSGLSVDKFEKLMNEFDRVYSKLQKDNNTKQLEKLNNILSGKRLNEKTLIQNLSELSFDKDILNDTILPARLGSQARINIAEDKVVVPSQSEVSGWKNKLENFANNLKIDLKNPDDLKRIFVADRAGGKLSTKPLFDTKCDSPKDYFKRFAAATLNGGKIYAFGKGESNAQKVVFEKGEFSLQTGKQNVAEPAKVSLGKRFLNTITFGRAFRGEIDQYKYDLKKYNETLEETQLIEKVENERVKDAEMEILGSKRIPLDDQKLRQDLGMEKSQQKEKSGLVYKVERTLKNDKTISN